MNEGYALKAVRFIVRVGIKVSVCLSATVFFKLYFSGKITESLSLFWPCDRRWLSRVYQ